MYRDWLRMGNEDNKYWNIHKYTPNEYKMKSTSMTESYKAPQPWPEALRKWGLNKLLLLNSYGLFTCQFLLIIPDIVSPHSFISFIHELHHSFDAYADHKCHNESKKTTHETYIPTCTPTHEGAPQHTGIKHTLIPAYLTYIHAYTNPSPSPPLPPLALLLPW